MSLQLHISLIPVTDLQEINSTKISELGTTVQEAYDLQQEMILRDTARVWRRMNPAVSIKDLKEHKTSFYIAEVFPVTPCL